MKTIKHDQFTFYSIEKLYQYSVVELKLFKKHMQNPTYM